MMITASRGSIYVRQGINVKYRSGALVPRVIGRVKLSATAIPIRKLISGRDCQRASDYTMSAEKFPWLYRDLESRRNNETPRFDPPIHRCPSCDRMWLCSDRYVQDYCSPQRFYPQWNSITCSLCLAGDIYDDDDRKAWWEAHGVTMREYNESLQVEKG
jgi:hypothetical protein